MAAPVPTIVPGLAPGTQGTFIAPTVPGQQGTFIPHPGQQQPGMVGAPFGVVGVPTPNMMAPITQQTVIPVAQPMMVPMAVPGMGAVPSPEQDAEYLYQAFVAGGALDGQLFNLLSHRNNAQLQLIRQAYQLRYQQPVEHMIMNDVRFGQDFRELSLALLMPRHEYLAREIYNAIKGAGTDEGALIDVIAFSSHHELGLIQQAYQILYQTTLLQAINADTSGDFRTGLDTMLTSNREGMIGADSLVDEDVRTLYKAGEGSWGTNEKKMIAILCGRPTAHIHAVSSAYSRQHKHTLLQAIEKETSGDFRNLLRATVLPFDLYFAERVNRAVHGKGTYSHLLQRMFVLNDRQRMARISPAYQTHYASPLGRILREDSSTHYKGLFNSLIL